MSKKTSNTKQLMKSVTVVARPTNDCNLGCRYCYVPDEIKKPEIMDLDIAFKFMDSFGEIAVDTPPKGVRIIWHGGEPMLPGIEFYREIVKMQRELSEKWKIKYENSIQTNGTLIDDEWAMFFKKHRFHVGISLDGPRELNDKTRVYRDGSGTFDKIVRGIKTIRKYGVKAGIIATITNESVHRMEELYELAKELGIGIKMNPLVPSENTERYDISLDMNAFARRAIELFDLWIDEEGGTRLDFAEDLIESLLLGRPIDCRSLRNCQNRFIAVGPNGDLYPCSRFYGHEGFVYGNINDDLPDVLTSPYRQQFVERYEHLEECHECEFTPICYGGCPHTAYVVHETIFEKDPMCEIFKALYSHISDRLIKELKVAMVAD
jgi:uncharacterized protein